MRGSLSVIDLLVVFLNALVFFLCIIQETGEFVVLLLNHLRVVVHLHHFLFVLHLAFIEQLPHSLCDLDDMGCTIQFRVIHHDFQAINVVTLHQGLPLVLDHGHTGVVQMDQAIRVVEEVMIILVD